MDSVEKTTIRKIYLRLLPLLFVAYFVCYLDRINVGFAALTMSKDLGFTATVFALGATAFFWCKNAAGGLAKGNAGHSSRILPGGILTGGLTWTGCLPCT